MEERLRFVAQLLDGEAMSEVCRAFGISRKTGYKIFERYKGHGLEALTDRSRRPVRYANQLPPQIESLIVAAKRDKLHWGARKIRELLVRRLDGDIPRPPPERGKVLPMCPVRSVTYVSGRSSNELSGCRLDLPVRGGFGKLQLHEAEGFIRAQPETRWVQSSPARFQVPGVEA